VYSAKRRTSAGVPSTFASAWDKVGPSGEAWWGSSPYGVLTDPTAIRSTRSPSIMTIRSLRWWWWWSFRSSKRLDSKCHLKP
jgi:hypothetical protein